MADKDCGDLKFKIYILYINYTHTAQVFSSNGIYDLFIIFRTSNCLISLYINMIKKYDSK